MVWSKIEPATGKKKFAKLFGKNLLILTNDKKGALKDLPEGRDVIVNDKGKLQVT